MMTQRLRKTCRLAVGIAVAAVFVPAFPVSASVTYDTRAMKGDQAPGTDLGVVYSVFSTPVINGVGQIAFTGTISGPGATTTSNEGLWSEGSGSLSLIAREGFAAPGTGPGVVFQLLRVPTLNDAGQTAFHGNLTGTGVDSTNNLGIWSEGSGSLSLVARTEDAAVDTAAGVEYAGLGGTTTVINNAGQIAFDASLKGTGVVGFVNDRGIWSEGSGSLSLVARGGDPAPGTGPGVVFGRSLSSPKINGSGQTAFVGALAGTGVDATNDRAIWSEGTGSLALVAREGDPAPGTDPGVVFGGLGSPSFNDAGQTAFRGTLVGTGVDTTNDAGIWSEGSGSLNLVAREGDAAPGTGPGVVFNSLGGFPLINSAGHTTFSGSLSGTGVDVTNSRGLWSEVSGSLSLVVRNGDQAPGTDPGVVFGGSGVLEARPNGAGQLVISGNLTGTGVHGGNNFGLWETDTDGVLTLIVRTGDLFDVNDDPLIDDFRTINLIRFGGGTGGEDGGPTGFNDAGQLAFRLRFTDNSEGIFVATLTAALAGDLNGDGFVGIADLNIVLGNWNQNVPPGDPLADPSGDGFVGIADLNVVLGNWNAGTPPGAPGAGNAVPEPGTMGVLGLMGLGLLKRGRPAC